MLSDRMRKSMYGFGLGLWFVGMDNTGDPLSVLYCESHCLEPSLHRTAACAVE